MIFVSKYIKLAAEILRNDKLPNCIESLQKNKTYNCWAFTAFALKLITTLCWVERLEMEKILKTYTRLIHSKNRQKGDIVVYRSKFLYGEKNYLLHTAILINTENNLILHKDGDEPLDIDNVFDVYTHYDLKITYRRLKNNYILT